MIFLLFFEVIYPFKLPENFQGWTKKDFKHYTEENIFDYMDGAGEIYLSFNFKNLYVVSYEKGKDKIILEIFDMVNPKSSFGIYTHCRGTGEEVPGIEEDCEISRNNLIFWKGNFFVSLFSENELKREVLVSFAKEVEKNIKKEKIDFEIIEKAKKINLNLKKIKYFFDMKILNYNYYIINQDIFYFKDGTEAIFSPYKNGYLLILLFKETKILEKALKNLKKKFFGGNFKIKEIEEGKWSGFLKEGNFILIFLDFKSKKDLEREINEFR